MLHQSKKEFVKGYVGGEQKMEWKPGGTWEAKKNRAVHVESGTGNVAGIGDGSERHVRQEDAERGAWEGRAKVSMTMRVKIVSSLLKRSVPQPDTGNVPKGQ